MGCIYYIDIVQGIDGYTHCIDKVQGIDGIHTLY